MEYREIVSVTGLGGLFQLVATKSDGAIVKNLADNTTKFISARLHNVTPLESIEIYTHEENVRLHEVLQKMKDSSDALPNAKNVENDTIKKYFKTVFPEIDDERVYVSDMKKIVKWFETLKANDLLNFDAYNQEEETEEKENKEEKIVEEKPVKKTAAKKEVAKETEEKPVKKAAKKTAEKDTEEKPAKKPVAIKKTTEKTETGTKPKKATAKKKEEK